MGNHRREGQYFFVKLGDVCRRGGKQCLLLIMYGFCSSTALYSASLLFRLLLFLYFFLFRVKSRPGVAFKSVAYKKKHVALFFSLLKMKK